MRTLALLGVLALPMMQSSDAVEYRTQINASRMSGIYVVSAALLASATGQDAKFQGLVKDGASPDYAGLKARMGQCFVSAVRACGGTIITVDWACEDNEDHESKFSLADDFKIEKIEIDAPVSMCAFPSWKPNNG